MMTNTQVRTKSIYALVIDLRGVRKRDREE